MKIPKRIRKVLARDAIEIGISKEDAFRDFRRVRGTLIMIFSSEQYQNALQRIEPEQDELGAM